MSFGTILVSSFWVTSNNKSLAELDNETEMTPVKQLPLTKSHCIFGKLRRILVEKHPCSSLLVTDNRVMNVERL